MMQYFRGPPENLAQVCSPSTIRRLPRGSGTLPLSLDLWNIHLHIFPQLDPPAMFGWASEKRSLFKIHGPEIKLHFLLGQLERRWVNWELAQCANMHWFLILISTWLPLKEVQPLAKTCKVLVHLNVFFDLLVLLYMIYHVPRLNWQKLEYGKLQNYDNCW